MRSHLLLILLALLACGRRTSLPAAADTGSTGSTLLQQHTGYVPFQNPKSRSYQQWMQALFSGATDKKGVGIDSLFSKVVPRESQQPTMAAGGGKPRNNTTDGDKNKKRIPSNHTRKTGTKKGAGHPSAPVETPQTRPGGKEKHPASSHDKPVADQSSIITTDIVRRPNILIVLADQWRYSALSTTPFHVRDYGVKTPFLEAFAEESLLFTRAYSANPVCTPARASILTSLHSHQHGLYVTNMQLPPDDGPTLAKLFKKEGYETYYQGHPFLLQRCQAAHM